MENEGLERIKVLASEIKDKALLNIIDYLLTREDMNEKYLNEEKSLKEMINYIKSEARKQAVNGVAIMENEDVYSWAIHYWDEPNEKLKLTSKKVFKEEKTKDKEDKKDKIVEKPEEKSKEKDQVKRENKVSNKKKKWQAEGQLTLFDFMKDFTE